MLRVLGKQRALLREIVHMVWYASTNISQSIGHEIVLSPRVRTSEGSLHTSTVVLVQYRVLFLATCRDHGYDNVTPYLSLPEGVYDIKDNAV